MILHLGVIDVPYVDTNQPKAPKASPRPRLHKAHRAKYGNITTGDVATFLENRYHVFENFYYLHQADIASDIENAGQGAVESLLMGSPIGMDAFGSATSAIEDRFKQFLSNQEMDKIGYPGVPTGAALRGVSHRFKHPYKKRPPRPSFVDTGLFQASAKAWIDGGGT